MKKIILIALICINLFYKPVLANGFQASNIVTFYNLIKTSYKNIPNLSAEMTEAQVIASFKNLDLTKNEDKEAFHALLLLSRESSEVAEGIRYIESLNSYNVNLPLIMTYFYIYFPQKQSENYPNIEKIMYWGSLSEIKNMESLYNEPNTLMTLALIYEFDDNYKDKIKAEKYFKQLYDFSVENNLSLITETALITGSGIERDFEKAWNKYTKKRLIAEGRSDFIINEIKAFYQSKETIEEHKRMHWLGLTGTLEGYFGIIKANEQKQ